MGRQLGLLLLSLCYNMMAALLAVGIFLLVCWGRKRWGSMDAGKWDAYFRTLSWGGVVRRILLFFALAYGSTAPLLWLLLEKLGYTHPGLLTALLGLLLFAKLGLGLVAKGPELKEKLQALRGNA